MYSSSEKLSDRQISRSGRSRRSTSAQASASRGATCSGIKQTPCLSAWIRSPESDLDPADFDRRAEIDQPDVGMAHARIQAEKLEPQCLDLVQVARAAAGDVADAAELLVDRRGDLAELRAQPGRVVEVPADRDLGTGKSRDVPQVVTQQVGLRLAGLGHRSPGAARSRRSR